MALPKNKELKLLQGLIEFVRDKTHYLDDDDQAETSKQNVKDFLEDLKDFCISNDYLDENDNLLIILSYLKD
jgi:hypothetical protein